MIKLKITDKLNDAMKKPEVLEGKLDDVKVSKGIDNGIKTPTERDSYTNKEFIADLKSAITEGVPISVDGVDLERRVGKELAQEINSISAYGKVKSELKILDQIFLPESIEVDKIKNTINQEMLFSTDSKADKAMRNFMKELEKNGIDIVEDKRGILESISNSKIYEKYDLITKFKDISNKELKEAINNEFEEVDFEVKKLNDAMSLSKLVKYAREQKKHHQKLAIIDLLKSKSIDSESIKKYGDYQDIIKKVEEQNKTRDEMFAAKDKGKTNSDVNPKIKKTVEISPNDPTV